MKTNNTSVLITIAICIIIAVLTNSCTHEKHGEIVRDAKGNYYELNGKAALGEERYYLIKIDTTKYKPVGFN